MERGQFYFITGGAHSGKSEYAEQLAAALGWPVVYVATAEAGDAEMAERIARHRRRRPTEWETVEEPREAGRLLERISRQDRVILIDCLTLLITNLIFQDQQACPERVNAVHQQKPRLAGIAEAAEILGWDKRKVDTCIERGKFPEPYAQLASGPVWLRENIEEYQRVQDRPSSGAGLGDVPDGLPPAVVDRIEAAVMGELHRLADIARSCRAHVILVSNEVGLGLVPADPWSRLFRDLAGWGNQLMADRADHALLLVSGLALDLKALHCSPERLIPG